MKADKSVSVRGGGVLRDITNYRQPPPPQQQQQFPLTPTSKSLVEKLLQENAALNKLIEEREYDFYFDDDWSKMVQALQAQNTTLAKELNAVKDKLSLLQQELACRNVVPKARDMEQEGEVQILPLPLNVPSQEEEVEPSCDHIIANKKLEIACSSPSKEGEESNSCSASGKEAAKGSSMGRRRKRAAEKVQSYKERPSKIKMRKME